MNRNVLIPCVTNTETSTYLLLSLVKDTTEYFDAGVKAQEYKKKGKWSGPGLTGGRPAWGR